jgi:hypothetical protein
LTLYAVALFLGAFLLFQVQPVIGKLVLPVFGGASAVWMTCLMFFQTALLAGYAYAHLLTRLAPRTQAWTHGALLAAALLFLPLETSMVPTDLGADDPTLSIVLLLATTIGVPFLLLSATSPLLQLWFARLQPDRSPYRLYAMSNCGSLLALVSYPMLVEPNLSLRAQAWTWSAGVVALVGFLWVCAASFRRAGGSHRPIVSQARPSALDQTLWLALATAGSILLLGTTNHLCQNVAPVPFLWVLPLALYLLSFILCFESDRFYARNAFGLTFVAAILGTVAAFRFGAKLGLLGQIGTFSFALFAGCMVCHGELARSRPAAEHLTRFYLTVAAGGALGGALVTLLAPLVFPTFWELSLGLGLTCLLRLVAPRIAGYTARRRAAVAAGASLDSTSRPELVRAEHASLGWKKLAIGALTLALVVVLGPPAWADFLRRHSILRLTRNFYGVLMVSEERGDDPILHQRRLTHGSTIHGIQFLAPERHRLASAYFGPASGIGIAMQGLLGKREGRRVGIVGLGAGTLAAYADAGTTLRFYEINPAVISIAEEDFTFLRDARARGARIEVASGDGRLRLAEELASGASADFDLLVLDAFSSDAIPVHLLTIEALDLYLRRLRPAGILAVHVSNLYLDLAPVVRALALARGLHWTKIDAPGDERAATTPSEWMLLARSAEALDSAEIRAASVPAMGAGERPLLWTDDYSSLLPILR